MGRKQTGTRKQIHLCIAILISLIIVAGCSFFPPKAEKKPAVKKDDSGVHLALGKKLFGESDYAGALREYEKASSITSNSSVIQEALLYTGLAYADPANPRRDYGKSIASFKRLTEGYPKSPFAEQARIILTLMKENEESSRTVERLKALIEASKKVDIGIEDKKREKAR